MSENEEKRQTIYYIPENFFGESRIFGGRIRVRYLIDSVVLCLIVGIAITAPVMKYLVNEQPFNVKAMVFVMTLAPGFLIGQTGWNGDPISVFLLNYIRWLSNRQVKIYNETPRLLGTDPVKAIHESKKNLDMVVGIVQTTQQKRIDKKNAEVYIEGETFEFQYDPGIDGYTEDVGDYSDDSLHDINTWPSTNIQIDAGSDLEGLEALLRAAEYGDGDSPEKLSEGFQSVQRANDGTTEGAE